jgi:hypothetical protein
MDSFSAFLILASGASVVGISWSFFVGRLPSRGWAGIVMLLIAAVSWTLIESGDSSHPSNLTMSLLFLFTAPIAVAYSFRVRKRAPDKIVALAVSYRWSADEVLLLNRLHMQHSPQFRRLHRAFRSTGVIFLCIGIAVFSGIGLTPQKLRAVLCGLGFISAAAALLVGLPHVLRKSVLKLYAKRPERDLVITYRLSDERIFCKSEVASSEMLWRTILKVLQTDDGFLLYVSDTQIHWLPIHGFQNPADVDRFANLATEKVEELEH